MARPPPILPRLDELPEELVSNISVKLGVDDVCSLRLTCRALEQRSFHEFANEHFREKCFLITTESLKVLHGIASSEKLRGYLHGIYIMPSLFSNRVFHCCHGDACTWKPSVRQSEAWRFYVQDQQELKKSGRDLRMLTEAFQQLPNLTNLDFLDSLTGVSRTADIRGLAKSARTTNNSPAHIPSKPSDGEYYRWKNHVWDITMRALAASGRSSLLHLNTDLDQMRNALSVSTNFDIDHDTASGLASAFEKVHGVGLYICSRKQSHLDDEDEDGIDLHQGVKNMAKFAALLPSLAHLRLCFSYSPSSRRLCNSFLAKTNLSKLRSVKLEKTYLAAKTFGPVVAQMKAAEEIFFVTVRLVEGTWRSILKTMQKLEKLEHLHLTWLEEKDRLAVFLKPLPAAPKEEPVPNNPGHLHAGPHAHEHLQQYGYDSEDESEPDDWSDEYPSDEDHSDDDDYAETNGIYIGERPDEESDFDDSDDSMPDLEPMDSRPDGASAAQPGTATFALSPVPTEVHSAPVQPPTGAPTPPVAPTESTGAPPGRIHYEEDDGLGSGPNRGQKLCVEGVQNVKKYLPIFIEEYHCADEEEEAAAAAAAMVGNAGDPISLFNSMIPMGMFGPIGPGGGAGGMVGGVFHGPPPPPGFGGAGAGTG